MFFYQFLFRYVPSQRKGWEKAKAMSVGKILRTVVTEVEIYEITIVPVVVDTSRQSHVPFGNTIFYIRTNINCSPISILSIFQYTTHMMRFEGPIIL